MQATLSLLIVASLWGRVTLAGAAANALKKRLIFQHNYLLSLTHSLRKECQKGEKWMIDCSEKEVKRYLIFLLIN